MSVSIVVDSALNIPENLLQELGIRVIPVVVNIDDQTYREGVDASRSELVKLIQNAEKATTSQPAPGEFLAVYEQLQGQVVSIHVTAKASGTCQTAQMAAEMAEPVQVKVVDSASASMGGGWLAIAAALAAKQGTSLEGIINLVNSAKAESCTYMTVPTLKYLQKSGRVNFAKAVIASLLSLKPVMHFNDGVVEVISKARSMQSAAKEMASLLGDKYGDKPLAIAIMHAEDETMAEYMRGALHEKLNIGYELVTELSSSLVVHGGPGTLAVSAIPLSYVKDLAHGKP